MRRVFLIFCLPVLMVLGLMPSASALQSLTHDRVVNPDPANFTPNVLDGEVDTIAQVGSMIVLGGSFTQVKAASGGPTLTRNHLVAFNKDTGAISSTFVPSMSADVKSLATGPSGTVYAGGKFNAVSGVTAYKITQLNVATGAIVSTFKPKLVSAIVRDVQYVNGRLFIGGEFTTIGGVERLRLAELNPTTGALLPLNVPVEGTHFGGDSQIYHMDVNPAATKMVLAGNFTSVGGQPRVEVAMVDLTTGTVSDWQTSRFETRCYDVFTFIVRDVEFSPDGKYFVIGTTGGYGPGSPSMCDSVSRWESNATGSAQDPTWIDYTGGDSTYTTAVTGSAIYAGGHERWWNNPAAADAAGPGAVARAGIAALDPVNGLPLSWNPGRARGQGVFAMLATTDGLFIGSDTDQVRGEYHAKVAFFPLAGGKTVPQPADPVLPVNLYSLGDLSTAQTNVLYRVNAGGEAIGSSDGGPDWMGDNGDPSSVRNSGSNAAAWSPVPNVNSSVPATTPPGIFDTERWDPNDANEMQWDFTVPASTNVEVRLYFANRCTCTTEEGKRRFDVTIEGQKVLSDFDIVRDVGADQTGEMKSFSVTSDGDVNIDFGHVFENPLVNGIEIINSDVPSTGPDQGVVRRKYNGSTVGAASSLSTGGVDFSNAQGAFAVGNDLYTAWSDGHLYKRTFDGTNFGAPQDVDLNGLTGFATEMRSMTGLFYTNGRIYYTLAGSSALYMRYFTVENDTVGAGLKDLRPFKVADNLSDVDWSQVRGMTFVGGKLYYANRQTGTLNRVDWANGAPVAGTRAVVSGPGADSNRWAQKALFAQQAVTNRPPTARIAVSCTQRTCAFDGSGSSDAEGPVTYLWDFGDGSATSTEEAPTHAYVTDGNYHVTLSVTDNDGAAAADTRDVSVQAAASGNQVSFVGSAGDTQAGSTTTHSLQLPAGVRANDSMLLYFTDNGPSVAVTSPTGWTQVGTTTTSGSLTRIWSKQATATDAGSTVSLTTASAVKGLLAVSAYRGSAAVGSANVTLANESVNRAAHTTPSTTVSGPNSWVVSLWTDKTAATTTWSTPNGQTQRQLLVDSGAGHPSLLLTDTASVVPSGDWPGATAQADSAAVNASMATVVLQPAG